MRIYNIGPATIHNPKHEKWWNGRRPVCQICQGVVVLTNADVPAWVDSNPVITAAFECPNCKADVEVIKS